MNNTTPLTKWVKRISSIVAVIALVATQSQGAYARILFEDDDYFNVQSEGIILDVNDNVDPGTAATGSVTVTAGDAGDTYQVSIGGVSGTAVPFNTDPTTTAADIATDITNNIPGYSATNTGATVNITADNTGVAGNATVSTAVVDGGGTPPTTTDVNTTGGIDGGDIQMQFGNDGSDATVTYNESTQDLVFATPGGDFDFSDDNLTTTGGLFFQNSSEFHIREVTDEATAACTTVGELVLDTTENRIYVCTATGAPGTWIASDAGSSQDFEDVYAVDTDDTLTASGTFDIDATGAVGIDSDAGVTIGGAGISLTSDGGILSLTGDGTNDIDILNASAAIDIDAGSFDVLTTGVFSIDGTGNSNITTDTGNLALSTTTAGDVDITGADNVDIASTAGDVTITAGDDVIFDDAQLTGIVQLTDTATDWDATFSSDGIVDIINSFASTATGEGASNVGIEDASAWFTGAEIEAALNEIEALFGSTTSGTFDFTEDNVLTDDQSVYSALDSLDLKWGDLASTANGEGASLVGIEDTAGNFTSTDVEGALVELANGLGNNYEVLLFYPEYEDATVFADGSNNKGTLEALYDDTDETGYYNWTTTKGSTQDIDIRFSMVLPTDFTTAGDFTFRNRVGSGGGGNVSVTLQNITDAATCATSPTNANAAWTTTTITGATIASGCAGISAGDIIEVQIKLSDDNGSDDYADIAWVNLDYTK
jgi:hypothetical protein